MWLLEEATMARSTYLAERQVKSCKGYIMVKMSLSRPLQSVIQLSCHIITASSDASAKDPTVCVWVRQWQPPTTNSNSSKIPLIYLVVQALINCVVVGVAIYLLRNTGQKVSLTVLQGKKLTV